ncbi:MAG: GIY-YIG nuclease family protein [Candidatus Doudnabacteria bacterium]
MYYVYVLQSIKDGDKYIGSTNDLKKRLLLHNSGRVFSTRLRTPFELVYYEAYKSEKDARVREHNLKLRSKAYIQLRRRIVHSLSNLVRG